MTAVSLGPFVLAGDRLAALIGLAAFVLAVEVAEWRRRRRGDAAGLGRWPMLVVLGWVLAARAGYVAANSAVFAARPLDVLKLWQGGFSATVGGYGAAFVIAASTLSARRAVAPLIVAAVLAALVSTGAMLALSAREPAAPGRLPAAAFADLDGRATPLDPSGRPVVVNLWASWCGPCRREMPMMQDIAAQAPQVVVRFVNQGETPAAIRRFLQETQLSGAQVRLDPERSLMARFGAVGLPATLFFRADGSLARGVIGEISRAELVRQIAEISARSRPSAGPPVAPPKP